jgi:hypothetical protein
VDQESRVEGDAAVRAIERVGVGVAAEAAILLEERDLVAPAEQPRRAQAGNTRADNGDPPPGHAAE